MIAAFVGWYNGLYESQSLKETIGILSNVFSVPGIIITGIALIGWAGTKGQFDMLSFGVGRVFSDIVPFMDRNKYDDFYKYREEKLENGRNWKPVQLICGLVSLALGAVFTIIYLAI